MSVKFNWLSTEKSQHLCPYYARMYCRLTPFPLPCQNATGYNCHIISENIWAKTWEHQTQTQTLPAWEGLWTRTCLSMQCEAWGAWTDTADLLEIPCRQEEKRRASLCLDPLSSPRCLGESGECGAAGSGGWNQRAGIAAGQNGVELSCPGG